MELKSNEKTLESIRANAMHKGKYGYDKTPLYDMETDQIIAKELHFLKIMDVLIRH